MIIFCCAFEQIKLKSESSHVKSQLHISLPVHCEFQLHCESQVHELLEFQEPYESQGQSPIHGLQLFMTNFHGLAINHVML